MKIKKVIAKQVLDSRREPTIQVVIKTGFFKRFKTSAPEGKSIGEYEAKSYDKSLGGDIAFLNSINLHEFNNVINKYGGKIGDAEAFSILKEVEEFFGDQIGANSLFAFEASLLKAFANENKKELYEFLGGGKNLEGGKRLPRPIGNAIGGGLHSRGINDKSPDFQEFLYISDSETIKKCIEINNLAYKLTGELLNSKKRNDEGAWETDKTNEEVLDIMNQIQQELTQKKKNIVIGVDVAASSFYKETGYEYKNPQKTLKKTQQIDYIKELINKYGIYYLEDPLEENDFSGFGSLIGRGCFIVGDDLTTTNPERLEKAIRMKSINAIIIKPNQIGSLIKTKQVIDLAKKYNIVTIMSHRSGETKDNTIADLSVAWGCDFIKTGIYGEVRESKLKRLIKIEKRLR